MKHSRRCRRRPSRLAAIIVFATATSSAIAAVRAFVPSLRPTPSPLLRSIRLNGCNLFRYDASVWSAGSTNRHQRLCGARHSGAIEKPVVAPSFGRHLCLLRSRDGERPFDFDDYVPPRRPTPGGYRRRRFGPFRRRFVSVQRLLVYLNVAAFAYQIVSAIRFLPALNAAIGRSIGGISPAAGSGGGIRFTAADVIRRVVGLESHMTLSSQGRWGRPVMSTAGPLFLDFAHQASLSRYQRHRFLTAGFLHGSLLHLAFNMRYLWKMPSWLEIGMGWPLYLSAYLVSIVTGNVAHSMAAIGSRTAERAFCIGASGGICGLDGLMFVMLRKMGNVEQSNAVFKNMILLVLFGLISEGISNAGHVGGFLGGAAVGLLFGPGYGRSYSMRKKFSLAVDSAPADYRMMMGFGIEPDWQKAVFPLWYLYVGVVFATASRPDLRAIPGCIWRGFAHPGLLSGVVIH